MKKILIGIGESKFSDYATAYGFELARKLKAEIGLIHIIEPMVVPPSVTTDTSMVMPFDSSADVVTPELMNIENEVSKKVLEAAVKKYAGDDPISTFTEYGDTADGILNCAKQFNADMIIIGTHSRSGIDRFLMGSVAEHVVRYAEVPVLVVPFVDSH